MVIHDDPDAQSLKPSIGPIADTTNDLRHILCPPPGHLHGKPKDHLLNASTR